MKPPSSALSKSIAAVAIVVSLVVGLGIGSVSIPRAEILFRTEVQTRAVTETTISTVTTTQFQALTKQTRPQVQPEQPQQPIFQTNEISVKVIDSKYKIATAKPTGWFTTGQDADIMLSGIDFNNTGGSLLFSHPGGIATDGMRLLLADTWNNRILIWNTLPSGNTPPDLVLGQKDFITNNPGTGADQMNWPISVSAAGGKVVVADANNNRILIWNSFPTRNDQPADIILEEPRQPDPSSPPLAQIRWPWGVWTDGTKLAISSTQGSRVLIWNTIPTRNDQPPDILLTAQRKMGTPRGITSNGQYLIVADHNARVVTGQSPGQSGGSATFVWKTWPTSNDQPYDFTMEGWRDGTFLPDNRLILLSTTHYPPSIWNEPPTSANDAPDLILGQTAGPGAAGGYYFVTGDGSGIAWAGGRLYFDLSNGNKIVVYNGIPSSSDQLPDFAIGAPDIYTNTLNTNFMLGNPVVATDGNSLFASSDFERKLYVWKSLPDESSADPDWVYSLPEAPWDNELWNNTLVLAGRRTVYVWRALPLNGEMPNLIFTDRIGSVRFQDLSGVALDDRYFYLADREAKKIYVWEGIPSNDSNPKFILSPESTGRLSSDGNYLVTATVGRPGGGVIIYRIDDMPSGQPIDVASRFNLPQQALVADGHLFVADSGFGRVLIWRNISDALAGRQADVVLGAADFEDISQEIGRNKLFSPASLAFDGSYLWIGEFKFSGRILRFSVH